MSYSCLALINCFSAISSSLFIKIDLSIAFEEEFVFWASKECLIKFIFASLTFDIYILLFSTLSFSDFELIFTVLYLLLLIQSFSFIIGHFLFSSIGI